MAIRDRVRAIAGTVGSALQNFSAGPTGPERMPDIGLRPSAPPRVRDGIAKRVEAEEGLTDTIAPSAGPTHDRQRSYPGTELDPETVDSIFTEADKGYWLTRYADLWDDLRQRDYQIHSLDRGRRVNVTTKDFFVHPSDAGDPVAVGLANAARAMFDQVDGFDTATYQLLSANGPGYSFQEPIYKHTKLRFTHEKRTQTIVGLHPREVRFIHQRHAYFRWDTDEPHLDLGRDGKLPLSEVPHKIWMYQTIGEGIASARGFFRPTGWLHLLGQNSMVTGGIMLRIFGMPQIRAFIPESKWKNEVTKAAIEADLQALGNAEPTVLPEWMKDAIKIDPPAAVGGGVDIHMKWRGFIDAAMAKVIEGAVLQMEASGGGPGSYALGNVHEGKSYNVSVCDAIGSCNHWRSRLLWAWIDLNQDALARIFNVTPDELFTRVPTCYRRVDRETTPKERAEILCMFADRGIKGSQRQIRNQYGYDEPVDDADAFTGKPVVVAGDGATVSSADAATGTRNPKPPPGPPAQERP